MNNTEAALSLLTDTLTDISVKEAAVLLNFISNFSRKITEDQAGVSNLR